VPVTFQAVWYSSGPGPGGDITFLAAPTRYAIFLSPFSVTGVSLFAATVALGGAVVVAVTIADAHRRAPAPRDGRAALASLGAVALGTVGAICAYPLAVTVYHGDLVPSGLVLLAAPVAAAVVVPFLPTWLRRPVLLAAPAVVVVIAYARPDPAVLPEQLVIMALLLVIAAAEPRAGAGLVGASALGAVVFGATMNGFMQGVLWPATTSFLQEATVPLVGGVVIAFSLWWAPVVLVRADRLRFWAVCAFAAGLLWLALQLGLASDTPLLVAGILVCLTLATGARVLIRRIWPGVAGAIH
jgi:hypothetical protein